MMQGRRLVVDTCKVVYSMYQIVTPVLRVASTVSAMFRNASIDPPLFSPNPASDPLRDT